MNLANTEKRTNLALSKPMCLDGKEKSILGAMIYTI